MPAPQRVFWFSDLRAARSGGAGVTPTSNTHLQMLISRCYILAIDPALGCALSTGMLTATV
jgi:hypothetical protein